jgi:hypothetical protein
MIDKVVQRPVHILQHRLRLYETYTEQLHMWAMCIKLYCVLPPGLLVHQNERPGRKQRQH